MNFRIAVRDVLLGRNIIEHDKKSKKTVVIVISVELYKQLGHKTSFVFGLSEFPTDSWNVCAVVLSFGTGRL